MRDTPDIKSTWQIVNTLALVVSAAYAVIALVIDGYDLVSLGLPVQIHVAIALAVFFVSVGALVRQALSDRHAAMEIVMRSGLDGPDVEAVTRRLMNDAESLKAKEKILNARRNATRPAMLLAVQEMYDQHGHADLNGIHRAWITGASFNEENCWICGEPRFMASNNKSRL